MCPVAFQMPRTAGWAKAEECAFVLVRHSLVCYHLSTEATQISLTDFETICIKRATKKIHSLEDSLEDS